MNFASLLTLLAGVAFAPTAGAGVITGRVVDTNGVGVAGVNIKEGSGNATVTNGGTNAGGFFTTTITPNGVYDLIFEPPTPPATTHLTLVLGSVNVTGTVNLGDVVLPPGVALTGRVVRATNNAPVPGVNLDVEQGGVPLLINGDVTDPLGNFSIAVPADEISVFFKTEGAPLPLLAPDYLELAPTANTSLGDVPLQPGFLISALVEESSNNVPVVGADIDVTDSVSGKKLFTPGDNTDGNGFVDFVVPAGTFDIEVCPQFDDLLVAETLLAQTVSANKFLGTILLDPGVVLSGTVLDCQGQAHAQVDVDLKVSATGAKVTLCGDNTNAAGQYQVVVPTGTFDVKFTPPPTLGLGTQTIPGVVVAGNKVVNGTLPCVFTAYCTAGTSASGCQALLTATGTASASAPNGFVVAAGTVEGSKDGLYFYEQNGRQANSWGNGTSYQCVVPPVKRGGVLIGVGTVGACNGSFSQDLNARWCPTCPKPNHAPTPGIPLQIQLWYRDPANTSNQTTSLSNAIEVMPSP